MIILTFLNHSKDDYKWFVLHALILDLFYAILGNISLFLNRSVVFDVINMAHFFCINLSIVSVFPLAFTRFFYLYFPSHYEKLFTKFKILIWLIFYDIFMSGIMFFGMSVSENLPYLSTILIGNFVLVVTFISFLVVLKIRKMMKLVDGSKNKTTLNNLRRAAFVCIFQMFLLSLHLIPFSFTQLFYNVRRFDQSSYDRFIGLYLFIISMYTCIYTIILILDNLIILCLLKSYRNLAIEVVKTGIHMVINGKKRIFGGPHGSRIHYSVAN